MFIGEPEEEGLTIIVYELIIRAKAFQCDDLGRLSAKAAAQADFRR